jgi:hypothetical protein
MTKSQHTPIAPLLLASLAALLLSACTVDAPVSPPAPIASASPAPSPAATPLPTPTPVRTPTAGGPSPSPSPTATSWPQLFPTVAPRPTPTAAPYVLDPPPAAGPFAMDINRPQGFVRQVTTSMCVPASMQIMLNLISDGPPDRTSATQQQLYALARSFSPWITDTRNGAAVNGWAGGLNSLGYGPYQPMSLAPADAALRTAAHAMRFTGKPVGLVVWAGDHAWVMVGFAATADPALTDDYQVTAVWIDDPWYGRTDRRWGAGLAPHTRLTTTQLADDFVPWVSQYFAPAYGYVPRWVIVAPQG